jgi:cytochrome c oxidase subunit I
LPDIRQVLKLVRVSVHKTILLIRLIYKSNIMTENPKIKTGPSYLEYKGRYRGIFAWIFSTDHKRIALLYLYAIMSMFIVGAILGLLMKLELIAPGKTVMDPRDL